MTRRAHRRRGAVSVAALIALPVLLLMFGLALFVALTRDAKCEGQNGADAAALAAARALACDHILVPQGHARRQGADPDRFRRAGEAAVALATANYAHGAPLALRFDSKDPGSDADDVVFGRVRRFGTPFEPLAADDKGKPDDGPVNAARVTVTTVPVQGPFGGANARRTVQARATAMLDWCVVGFRPKGDERAPVAPLGFYTDHHGDDADGWDGCHKAAADEWAFDPDTNRFVPGSDGIPEVAVVVGGRKGKGEAPGLFLRLGADTTAEAVEQFRSGLTPAQCEKFAGGFRFAEDNTVSAPASPDCPADGTDARRHLEGVLAGCVADGRPRVWPLFHTGDDDEGKVKVSGWVGARLVAVGAGNGGGLRLVLQPAVVCHPAVETDPGRPGRPPFWRNNRTVCRARLVD